MSAPEAIELTPITVLLTPNQLARLETLIADVRGTNPALDDNDLTDALFDTGLAAFESLWNLSGAPCMTTKKKPAPLRDQILDFLRAHDEATLKQIAAATTERDYPSRVTTELNKLRTEAVVECEKKKGKNELWYWLAAPSSAVHDSQPAVEQNTGSSAEDASATPASGAAVQPHRAGGCCLPLGSPGSGGRD